VKTQQAGKGLADGVVILNCGDSGGAVIACSTESCILSGQYIQYPIQNPVDSHSIRDNIFWNTGAGKRSTSTGKPKNRHFHIHVTR
jgi:hypothetical protein